MSKKRFDYLNPEAPDASKAKASSETSTAKASTSKASSPRKPRRKSASNKVEASSDSAADAKQKAADTPPEAADSSNMADTKLAEPTDPAIAAEVADITSASEAAAQADKADTSRHPATDEANPSPESSNAENTSTKDDAEPLHSLPWGKGRMQQERAQLNVRIPAALKRQALAKAALEGRNLNDVIESLLLEYLQD